MQVIYRKIPRQYDGLHQAHPSLQMGRLVRRSHICLIQNMDCSFRLEKLMLYSINLDGSLRKAQQECL